jgi:hypothetical protein
VNIQYSKDVFDQIDKAFATCKNGVGMDPNPYLQARDRRVAEVLLRVEELGLKQAASAL